MKSNSTPVKEKAVKGLCFGCKREWVTSERGGGTCPICGKRIVVMNLVAKK